MSIILIIPYREKSGKKYFKDASVDEVVDSIVNSIDEAWKTYLTFHTYDKDYNLLGNQIQVHIKGYDGRMLPDGIPLQKGDIAVRFMTQDIPEDFIGILELLFAGFRYVLPGRE